MSSQKMYPCRHCDRKFSTAEGMAGHTNVHARTLGVLGKRKAEIVTVGRLTISPQPPHPQPPHPQPSYPPTTYTTTYWPVNYGPAVLVPHATMGATSFNGQVPNQSRGSLISSSYSRGLRSKLYAPRAATVAPPPPIATTTKALEVRDFLGPFAAKATPSALVIVGEEDGFGLDLELRL